jgi:hypothetical protein
LIERMSDKEKKSVETETERWRGWGIFTPKSKKWCYTYVEH